MNIERFRKIIQYSDANRNDMETKVKNFYSFVRMSSDKEVLNIMQIARPSFQKKGYLVLEMPFADDDFWCPVIDLDNGKIVDWPSGITASIQYKVCDECEIDCVDDEGNVICTNDNNYYVPDFLCPKEKGYGDYIMMEVDENGFIKEYSKKDVVNWIKNQTKTNNNKIN